MNKITSETLFIKATQDIKSIPHLNNETLLKLYGLFKQVTMGDCLVNTSSFFDLKATAKYNAWNKLNGMTLLNAQVAYIKLVKTILLKNENKNNI